MNSNVAELWGSKNLDDPESVCRRTGYVFCVAGFPVIWESKLQTEIATSVMMAEYIALSTAMSELLLLQRLVEEVS
eukprot:1575934-Ditylum_brightwellii.AAC.1